VTGIALGVAFLLAAAGGPLAALAILLVAATVAAVVAEGRLLAPALAVVVAAAAGAWRGEPPPSVGPVPWADAASAIRGRVTDVPAVTARSQRFVLAVDEVEVADRRLLGQGRVCLWGPALPEVGLGDRIAAGGRVVPIVDAAGASRAYLRQQGCAASMQAAWLEMEAAGSGWQRWVARASRRLSRVLQEGAAGDAGVLLSGLVTGDDHAFSEQRRQAFLLTGTTHLTAVSGSNVALLVTVAVTLGAATGRRRRLVWLAPTTAAVWAYALLAGAEPPAVRAALVATAALFAARVGRRPDCVTLVVLAAAAMVALQPSQLWRLSFQLSLAASLALAVVLPAVAPTGLWGWLRAGLLALLAAQLATLPILLPLDGRASPIALPANLLVGPLVDVAFPLAALASVAGLLWAPFGEVVLFPAWLCAEGILAIVDALAAAPGATSVGAVPLPHAAVLTASVSLAILLLSDEGKAWLRRLGKADRSRLLWPRSAPQLGARASPAAHETGAGRLRAGAPRAVGDATRQRLPFPPPGILALGEGPAAGLRIGDEQAGDKDGRHLGADDGNDARRGRQSVHGPVTGREGHALPPAHAAERDDAGDDPRGDRPGASPNLRPGFGQRGETGGGGG